MEAARQGAKEAPVLLDFLVPPVVCFAMEHAGIPVVRDVVVANRGTETLGGLEIRMQLLPDLGAERAQTLKRLAPGETLTLDVLDFRLEPGRVRTVRERERAELRVRLLESGRELASGTRAVELLAYNEWPGAQAPLGLLACFVTPNAPGIEPLLAGVRAALQRTTGDGSIDGYQGGVSRARAEVAALHEALGKLGIGYAGGLASFETQGQKVRFPDAILTGKLANCLDASLLCASALEQMGLNPLVVLVERHAFVAAWLLPERFPEGLVEDPERLKTIVQLGQIVAFDPTVTLQGGTFASAEQAALARLGEQDAFVAALDVAVQRTARFLPLPLRAEPPTRGEPVSTARPAAGAPERAPATPGAGPVSAPPKTPRAATAVELRFARWRERLLDLTLRNKLLNFQLDARGALPLEVADVAKFEDLLAAGRTFELEAVPDAAEADPRNARLVKARMAEPEDQARRLEDMRRGVVHTGLGRSALWTRAAHLDRTARVDLEEGGATTLFVAVGFLRWLDAEQKRYLAPLLLYPITLSFDRRLQRARFARLDEDPIPNHTLVEKLRRDHSIDGSALAALEPDESGVDVPQLLRAWREAIQRVPRWEVLEEAHIGHFTFTKFLMWKDLGDNAEVLLKSPVVGRIAGAPRPDAPPAAPTPEPSELDDLVPPAALPLVVDADSTQIAAVLAALRSDGLVLQGPPGTGKSQTITNLIALAVAQGESVLFVSEKMAALEVVHRRLQAVGLGDFCLELHSHKSNKRLVLDSFARALEHGRHAGASAWDGSSAELGALRGHLNEVVRGLHGKTPLGPSYYDVAARLIDRPPAPRTALRLERLAELTAERFAELQRATDAFAISAAAVEPVGAHPLRLVQRFEWRAEHEQQFGAALEAARAALGPFGEAASRLARALRLASPRTLGDVRRALASADRVLQPLTALTAALAEGPVPRLALATDGWQPARALAARYTTKRERYDKRRKAVDARWTEDLLTLEVAALHAKFARWATAFFLLAWLLLRRARQQLRAVSRLPSLPSNTEIARDLGVVTALDAEREELDDLESRLRQTTFAGFVDGLSTQPASLGIVVERADRAQAAYAELAALPSFAPWRAAPAADLRAWHVDLRDAVAAVTVSLKHLEARLASVVDLGAMDPQHLEGFALVEGTEPGPTFEGVLRGWSDNLRLFRPWCMYRGAGKRLAALGLASLVSEHAAAHYRAVDVPAVLERAVLEAWRIAWLDRTPALRDFDGGLHRHDIASFSALDAGHMSLARDVVVSRVVARVPRSDAAARGSELDLVRRELRKKTRHLAVRKLLAGITDLRARLKPCFLMSPLSVAQYLPATAVFDLVVFDEASQIETHDAIGAIGRGRRVVVVGDSKQLPPSRFFTRKPDDEDAAVDENDVEDLDSILDEALAVGIPERLLGWHYRSRHDALIEFSNREYYEGRLQVFPAAARRADDLGVSWHPVADGVYQRAGKSDARTNPREARALVEYLAGALARYAPDERTFGIVTFSLTQRDLIADMLDEQRRLRPELEPHFAGAEAVFVKNLENVQGDERDEILFSIGYAPDERGKLRHHFGPLSNAGGERRLNVAITRARRQLRVFSTLRFDQIDTARTSSTGALHLREFLRFAAQRGASAPAVPDARALPTGGIEREVQEFLVQHGFRVETRVGCGQYRLDLAVVDPARPGTHAIGIECDGASYAGAATARDRDRLRGEVLQKLGWRLHRVWSLEWCRDREREGGRLLDAVRAAMAQAAAMAVDAEPTSKRGGPPEPGPSADRAEVCPSVPAVPGLDSPLVAVREELTPRPLLGALGAGGHAPPTMSPPGDGPDIHIGVPYRAATLPRASGGKEALLSAGATGSLRSRILTLVEVEGPLPWLQMARRVAECWDVRRCSGRMTTRINDVALSLCHEGSLVHLDGFLWLSHEKRESYDEFRPCGPHGAPRELSDIAPEELANAMETLLLQSGATPKAELLRATSRVFGVLRLREGAAECLERALRVLTAAGRCRLEGERVVPSPVVEGAPGGSPPPGRRPSFTLPEPSGRARLVVDELQHSAAFELHVAVSERQRTLDLVGIIVAQGCRASYEALAKGAAMPAYRGPGLARRLSEQLNIDQYEVVRFDDGARCVDLDEEKLVQLFGLAL